MKKTNIIKKVLLKSFVGFTLGVTFLMLSYVSIYFICGKNTFENEINQLHNIKTLINQLITNGITYYLIFISFNIYSILLNKQITDKYLTKHPVKCASTMLLISFIFILIISCILSNTKIYSQNIAVLNMIILLIIYSLTGLCFSIKSIKESHWIKKINQKLNEINS